MSEDQQPTLAAQLRSALGSIVLRCDEEDSSVDCSSVIRNIAAGALANTAGAADEIQRLREKRLQDLRQFLDKQRPKIDGSGWLTRDILRRTILDFLVEFEAAEAKEKEK